ncbi:MAG TPA: hypothetical protein DCZ51_15720 [Bacteroidales bacterium]|nr:hypothetical protein [Bacteroidales bacterium]
MKKLLIQLFVFSIVYTLSSCRPRSTPVDEPMPVVSVKAEQIAGGTIENEISFNGSTVYLKKSQVSSPISGYVVSTNIKFGQEVQKGMVLFELKTRESKALESVNDTSSISGTIKIHAGSEGFISELNINESGVYVAEGSILCSIVNNIDLMVRLNVPYEYVSILSREKKCKIRLADNTVISGSVFRILPSVDEANQTQTVLVKPGTSRLIPENLNLSIFFTKEKHDKTMLVSKSSLMTNETQSEFWVMKINAGDTAVKIPVTKGIENDSIAEIISPYLKVNDLIISEGAYGLPDSTIVSIVK